MIGQLGLRKVSCHPLSTTDQCSPPAQVLGWTALPYAPRNPPPDLAFPSRRVLRASHLPLILVLPCVQAKSTPNNPPPDQTTCVISGNWSQPKSLGAPLEYFESRETLLHLGKSKWCWPQTQAEAVSLISCCTGFLISLTLLYLICTYFPVYVEIGALFKY